jgi:N-methylhydantoinase A
MGYYCGVDIGGTFTDCVVIDDDGKLTLAKVSSTPPDFARGFLDAVGEAAHKVGLERQDFLSQTSLLLHGTTVGTNVLVQRRGARTGLITTRGHRDHLLMMRSYGRSAGLPIEQLLRVSRHRKPEPIIPPQLIREVSERMDWEGDVVLPFNDQEARAAVQELVAEGVEAIAISFLWGFVNPLHELRMKQLVQELAPDVFISCAHQLIAKPGEYERTAAAAINAFIGPSTARYVREVDEATTEDGYQAPLLIMQASGGVAPAELAAASPLFTIGSGPVGGVTGAAYLARRLGHENVIAADMGGTSYDVGIIAAGEPLTSSETIINQYTFFMPRLDIESIGAGGGSLVWVDEHSHTLRVGPHSAGAVPGPACYGRGGTEPTTTDCDVILGRYNPDNFLAGQLKLDVHAARTALEGVGAPMGMDPVTAADGALRIVESHMADLMRQMTVERGLDPRDFVIYSFGGAGGAHAVAFARELGCRTVVVPLGDMASTWSALGVMTSDVLHLHEYSELLSSPFSPARLNEIYERLEVDARAQLKAEGFGEADIELSRIAEMKFSLQIHVLEVPVPAGRLGESDMTEQVQRFVARYEQTFGEGSSFPGAGTQIGTCRVVARGRVRTPELPEHPAAQAGPAASREVFWREQGGMHATDIYRGEELGAGSTVSGPAIIELPVTTVVLPPGAQARVDSLGSIVIDVGSESGGPEPAAVASTSTNGRDA